MFFRGGIFRILFLALLVIGLLSLGGYLGWSQGYTAGVVAADGGGAPVAPRAYYGFGFFPFFFGFGLLFKIALFFLFFMLIGKLFRFWAWRGAGGPGGGWGRSPRYGPPPWYGGERGPAPEARDDDDIRAKI